MLISGGIIWLYALPLDIKQYHYLLSVLIRKYLSYFSAFVNTLVITKAIFLTLKILKIRPCF